MKQVYLVIVLMLCAMGVSGQVSTKEVVKVTTDITGASTCLDGRLYYNGTTGVNWERIGGVCTKITAGGAPGTVTTVSGTANQISVATGTTTPVISLPSAIILPGTLAALGTTINVGATSTGATDLLINPTTKASGSLIDAQVNGASKFSVGFNGGLIAAASSSITGVSTGTLFFSVNNSSSAVGAFSEIKAAGSGAAGAGHFYQFGGSYTTSNQYVQNSTLIEGDSAAGLGLSALAGAVNVYTGNTARLTVAAGGGVSAAANFSAASYSTATNCSDSAGAAACGSAAAGSFVIDAAATSVVVSTTSLTANSQVFLQEDSSLGARLGVTCNTQSILILGPPVITARTAGTSFTVSIVVGPTATPMCLSYHLVN